MRREVLLLDPLDRSDGDRGSVVGRRARVLVVGRCRQVVAYEGLAGGPKAPSALGSAGSARNPDLTHAGPVEPTTQTDGVG
jgi:hypothetical protein